jgi:hypothetical protein
MFFSIIEMYNKYVFGDDMIPQNHQREGRKLWNLSILCISYLL